MKKISVLIIAIIATCCISLEAQEARLMIPIEHQGGVVSTKWSPDGQYIITASVDKTAKIWHLETGLIVADLKGHNSQLTGAIFSPDGMLVATTSNDATAKLWNPKTGKLLLNLDQHTSVVDEAIFSKDSRWLATRSTWDQTIKIWDTKTGALQSNIEAANNVPIRVYFNPEGNLLYVVYFQQFMQVWEWKKNKLIREINYPQHPVCEIADLSEDGSLLLTIDSLQNINTWDMPSGKLLSTFPFTDEPEFINACLSPDASLILIAKADFTLMIIDRLTSEKRVDFTGHRGMIRNIKFSPNGDMIMTNSWDNQTIIWNTQTGEPLQEFEGGYENGEFDPFGKLIALSSIQKQQPQIWNTTGDYIMDLIGLATPVTGAKFSHDGSILHIKTSFDGNHTWDLNAGRKIANIQTDGNENNTSDLSPDGELLAITTNKKFAELWDAQTGKPVTNLGQNRFTLMGTLFDPNSSRLITMEEDSSCQVWDIETEKKITEFKSPDLSRSIMCFNTSGSLIAITNNSYGITLLNTITGDTAAKMDGHQKLILTVRFSPDDTKMLTTSLDEEVKLWDVKTGQLLGTFPNPLYVNSDAIFSPDSSHFAIISDMGIVILYNISTLQEKASLSTKIGEKLFVSFSLDSKELFILKKDSIISIYNISTSKLIREINLGFNTLFEDINFSKGLIIASNNAEAKLFSIQTGKLIAGLFSFPNRDWAVLYPSGLFDASQKAMDMMYWVKDMEVIELSQLKEGYYQPGIWELAMSGNNQMPVPVIDDIGMQPDIDLGEIKDGLLPVTLTKRDGGYGRVAVFVNGKLVIEDARPENFDRTKPSQSFSIDVSNFNYPDSINEITVRAESEDGMLVSRGGSKKVKRKIELTENKPAFYAIICGTSEYADTSINLSFSDDDARAIARALDIGASNQFSRDSVHLYVLTSPGDTLTSKQNIRNTFETVGKKAKPEDIVMVYLSGHGIAVGGDGKGDFYYLTKDAKSKFAEDYKNARTREPVTISTEELTQWMNAIPAQKNIMIIDACGSGKAVNKMFNSRSLEASQIKALDRMKDRTGLFIISGCAEDQESFEANSLSQGLLTYSLLEGIKGAALKEDIFMDILNIFNYAVEQVPRMAKLDNKKQEPRMLNPERGSYSIGIIQEEDRQNIPLAKPKPVFVKARVVEQTIFDDTLNLSINLNKVLRDIFENRTRRDDIVFIDEDKYPGACKITGGYLLKDNLFSFSGQVTCDQLKKPLLFENKTQDELIKLIIDESLKVAVEKIVKDH